MTLKKAMSHFFASERFKELANQQKGGGTYRAWKNRWKDKKMDEAKAIKILKAHGYKVSPIEVTAPE